jgi:ketosteroid isomerase-like protein
MDRTTRARRSLLVLAVTGISLVSGLAAQRPGDELPSSSRARQDYLRATYQEVKELLEDWHVLHRQRDGKSLSRLFTSDGLYSPVEGWVVQGTEEVRDSLDARLPRVTAYRATLLDYTAGGTLAYYMGRLTYRLGEGVAERDVSGTFVMVLYLDGHRWRIRSYVERA